MASTKKNPPHASETAGSAGLKIVVLCAGAVLMSLEIVGSRLLAPHFGNSVYVWGSLISVFLIALSIGYWVGGHLADRKPSIMMLAGISLASAIFIFLIPLIGHPLCRTLLAWGLGEQSGPLVAASILFLPPSFILGMVSPFSVRLMAKNVQSVGRTAGSLYALSTIGSIVGTLSTTFVLIPFVGVSWILKCLGAIMALQPVILMIIGRGKSTSAVAPLAAALIGLTVHSSPSFTLDAGKTLLVDEDTPYHHVSVIDAGTSQRFLQFDRYIESSIKLQAPYQSTAEYTNYFHLAFLAKPEIKRALFIGAGGGIGPRTFSIINPRMDIDVVDIDKRVLDIAAQYFFMPNTANIHPIAADGRMFFRNNVGLYDCIILDAFTVGGRIPFHLTTQEYLETLKTHLTPDGVFMMNISGTLEGARSEIYRSVYRTVQSVFPKTSVFARGYGQNRDPNALRNLILLSTTGGPEISPEMLGRSVDSYPAKSYITSAMMRVMTANLIEPPRERAAVLMSDDYAPIETMSF
jgi:spermidine synthase